MSFNLKNYQKSTPAKWQVIGDLALVLIPVLITLVDQSPLSPELQTTVVFWMSAVLALVKVLTQFFNNEQS